MAFSINSSKLLSARFFILCQVTFYFLSVNVSAQQRGTELTAQQLVDQGCALQAFHIRKL